MLAKAAEHLRLETTKEAVNQQLIPKV
uniref:Uncharacterized protein n=1 Tax=Anguilla anguilla TaxID=7936 RepID=A0A0E9THH0_ANGAN